MVQVQPRGPGHFAESMKSESNLKGEAEPAAESYQDENRTDHSAVLARLAVSFCASFP